MKRTIKLVSLFFSLLIMLQCIGLDIGYTRIALAGEASENNEGIGSESNQPDNSTQENLQVNAGQTPDASIKLQAYNANRAKDINTIYPWYKISNTGNTIINLADIKLRYYYTINGEKKQNFWCDWAGIDRSKITGAFIKMPVKADGAGKELVRKITQYTYDDNGNELRQGVSYIQPSNIKLRQSSKGSAYGDNVASAIDKLIEKTSSTYDGFNRLEKTEVIRAGVRTAAEYSYDGDGLRVSRTVRKSDNGYAAEVTNYTYDRQHVILETDASGNVKVRYARGINYISRTDSSDSTSYFLFNGHGDVVQTVSGSGDVENNYGYDIWGNPELTVEEYSNSIRYSGEFLDAETGLYYLRARYYNPYTGRFVSEDSYWGEDENPASLNLYTYCENDPVSFIDPTGHWAESDKDLTQDAQLQIADITTRYTNTTDLKEKERLHAQAEAIRSNPANIAAANETAHNSGFYGEVSDALSGGTCITAAEWNAMKDSFTVAGSVNITTDILQVNVAGGYNATINNSGSIGIINTGSQSNVTINNDGTINAIYTGTGSSTNINNNGSIDSITTGYMTSTIISNQGTIGRFIIGKYEYGDIGKGNYIIDNDGRVYDDSAIDD